jgi:hypothetical protein
MTHFENCDGARFIINEVDDAKVALPYSVAIGVTGQFVGAVRPRVGRQPLDTLYEPLTIHLRRYRGKLLAGGGLDQNSI